MTVITSMTAGPVRAGERIGALDLEPVAVKLTGPEPGQTAMTLAQAGQLTAACRCFLKLCAWYPDQDIAPSTAIGEVWDTRILDTGKYAAGTTAVSGYFLHHFPCSGMRGTDDLTAWQAACQRTRELFARHFSIDLPAGQASAACHNGGSDRGNGGSICYNRPCGKHAHDTLSQQRPRPGRTTATRPATDFSFNHAGVITKRSVRAWLLGR